MDTESVVIVDDDHSFGKIIRDVLRATGHATIAAARRVLSRSGSNVHSTPRSAFSNSTHNEQYPTKDSESLALLILILASLVIVMGTGLLLVIPRP